MSRLKMCGVVLERRGAIREFDLWKYLRLGDVEGGVDGEVLGNLGERKVLVL